MSTTKITDHTFEFGSTKYFRDNCQAIEMCSNGKKKDPIGDEASLEVNDRVMPEILAKYRVKTNEPAKIDWATTTKAALNAQGVLKFFGIGKSGAVEFTYESAKSANLELIYISIDLGPLKEMLNKDAGAACSYLRTEGSNGRIVNGVFVVVSAELSQHFSAYGSASASVQASGSSASVSATGGKYGTQTIVLGKGSIFAYSMAKVKNWTKDKKAIEDMDVDYKS
jgi:hypothetical protein